MDKELRHCPNCGKDLSLDCFRRKSVHTGKIENDFVYCTKCMDATSRNVNRLDFVRWFEKEYPNLYNIYVEEMLSQIPLG